MLFQERKKLNLDYRWSEPIPYYIDMLATYGKVPDIGVSLYINDHFISQISFEISSDKQIMSNIINIHNFQTDIKYRNMGFGKQLLSHIAVNIRGINRFLGYDTVSVSGTLDIRDLPYWKFSLPMYYSFAKKVIGPKVICCLNNEQVRKDNLISFAYNLNKQNIAVNFKFINF